MSVKERILQLDAQKKALQSRISELENDSALLDASLDVKTQASGLLDALAEEEIQLGVQTYVHLLEEGLKAIFPEQEIGQVAEVVKLRGKVSVRLKTLVKGQDGLEVEGDGLETFGGAVATIQSLLLRVALILKRGLRPLLILDETFPAVDDSRLELLVTFLKVLCSRLGMDILCITHQSALAEHAWVNTQSQKGF
jgi:DNA repair exonuclease SbcCD ATPase subunit